MWREEMKIKFQKSDDEIKVFFTEEEKEIRFEYSILLKELYENKKIEIEELQGEFTEQEKNAIISLINNINDCVNEEIVE